MSDVVSARERFSRELAERAGAIKCARNDVYTAKYWQLALNFVLGGAAVAFLIISMVDKSARSSVFLIVAVALAVVVVVYNLVLRSRGLTSFLQYSARVGDTVYCYRIIGRYRSAFFDGENVIEVDHDRYIRADRPELPQYRFDFFADMDPTMRIGKSDREIFKGTIDVDGRVIKCKIVFKNGTPYYGVIGGARIKYFDVNDTKEKFVVPQELADAVKAAGVTVPKLSGVTFKSGPFNVTRQ